MIICNDFRLDGNALLKSVQHDAYWSSVWMIFASARDAFVRADDILQTHLALAQEARAMTGFDHRDLQLAHDFIAAQFRIRRDDGGQLDLFLDPSLSASRYLQAWRTWLRDELEQLARYPDFVRSVVERAVFGDAPFGRMAERTLLNLLGSHFGHVEELCSRFQTASEPLPEGKLLSPRFGQH